MNGTIVVCVGELVEGSIRELLEGERVNFVTPDNKRWTKRDDILVALLQDGVSKDIRIAAKSHPVVVLSCISDVAYLEKMHRWKVRDVIDFASTGEEVLASLEKSQNGVPLEDRLTPANDVGLSPRQEDVLVGIGMGLSNKAIADKYELKESYIQQVTFALYEKLEVNGLGNPHCRIAAMEYAREHGYV